jgi:serine/threonine protein kinase
LGKGTFADVYRAKSSSTQQIRAIKKVDKSKSPGIERLLNNEF